MTCESLTGINHAAIPGRFFEGAAFAERCMLDVFEVVQLGFTSLQVINTQTVSVAPIKSLKHQYDL
jgi:hypothetical protein